jgi:hypothetical protein
MLLGGSAAGYQHPCAGGQMKVGQVKARRFDCWTRMCTPQASWPPAMPTMPRA